MRSVFFLGCWYPGTAGSPCSVWPPCVPFQNWDDLGWKIPKSSTICGGFRSRKLVFVFTNEVEAQRFLLSSLDGGGVWWAMKPSKSGHRMGMLYIYILYRYVFIYDGRGNQLKIHFERMGYTTSYGLLRGTLMTNQWIQGVPITDKPIHPRNTDHETILWAGRVPLLDGE